MESEEKPSRPVKVYEIDRSLKLTAKQAKFVYEYLIDYNGTQAAIRAGYAKKSAAVIATENLRKPNIKQAIDDGKMFYMFQNGMDADWIRKKRLELLERCLQEVEVMVWDKVKKKMVGTGEYVFREVTARGVLGDMAKDIGLDAPTQVEVDHKGKVEHEHTVKEQMNFTAIRKKVDQHKKNGLH